MKLQPLFVLALCAASATIANADTWTTLNPDGSITRTEMTPAGEVKGTTTTPVAPTSRNSTRFSSEDDARSDRRDRRDRDHRHRRPDQVGVAVYPHAHGYVQTYPYSFQLPGFSPFGGPIISVLPQPGIQTYPAYPVYGCPVPVNPYPVYGYPVPVNPYPVYGYPSYPSNPYPVYSQPYGNGTYTDNSTYGGITFGSGGLNVTIGGSRTQTTTSTSIWGR